MSKQPNKEKWQVPVDFVAAADGVTMYRRRPRRSSLLDDPGKFHVRRGIKRHGIDTGSWQKRVEDNARNKKVGFEDVRIYAEQELIREFRRLKVSPETVLSAWLGYLDGVAVSTKMRSLLYKSDNKATAESVRTERLGYGAALAVLLVIVLSLITSISESEVTCMPQPVLVAAALGILFKIVSIEHAPKVPVVDEEIRLAFMLGLSYDQGWVTALSKTLFEEATRSSDQSVAVALEQSNRTNPPQIVSMDEAFFWGEIFSHPELTFLLLKRYAWGQAQSQCDEFIKLFPQYAQRMAAVEKSTRILDKDAQVASQPAVKIVRAYVAKKLVPFANLLLRSISEDEMVRTNFTRYVTSDKPDLQSKRSALVTLQKVPVLYLANALWSVQDSGTDHLIHAIKVAPLAAAQKQSGRSELPFGGNYMARDAELDLAAWLAYGSVRATLREGFSEDNQMGPLLMELGAGIWDAYQENGGIEQGAIFASTPARKTIEAILSESPENMSRYYEYFRNIVRKHIGGDLPLGKSNPEQVIDHILERLKKRARKKGNVTSFPDTDLQKLPKAAQDSIKKEAAEFRLLFVSAVDSLEKALSDAQTRRESLITALVAAEKKSHSTKVKGLLGQDDQHVADGKTLRCRLHEGRALCVAMQTSFNQLSFELNDDDSAKAAKTKLQKIEAEIADFERSLSEAVAERVKHGFVINGNDIQ